MVTHEAVGKDLDTGVGFEVSHEGEEEAFFLVLKDETFVDDPTDDMKDLGPGPRDKKRSRNSHNETKITEQRQIVNNNVPVTYYVFWILNVGVGV